MVEAIRVTPAGIKKEVTNLRKLVRFALRKNSFAKSCPIQIIQVNNINDIPEQSSKFIYSDNLILGGPLNLELIGMKNVLLLTPNEGDSFRLNNGIAFILLLDGEKIQFREIEFSPLCEHRDGYRYLNGLLIFFAGNF